MKNSTKIILTFVILAVIAIIFIYLRRAEIFGTKNEPAPVSASAQGSQVLPVNVVEIHPQKLENNLNITGTVLPNEMVSLRSEISGLVQRIAFKEGQFVKKGTPLVYLNDDELSAQ